jgi:hypothetical protein
MLNPITVRRARITLTATRTGLGFSGIRFSSIITASNVQLKFQHQPEVVVNIQFQKPDPDKQENA